MGGPILITGAGGRLGSVLATRPGTIGLTRAALDLTKQDAIAAALVQYAPRCVINAAAFSDVDGCERDAARAHAENAVAPGILARACASRATPFIHVSTDYVFGADGHDRPRREQDQPAPLNAYGRSKLAGEALVQEAGGAACVVRVAWLFGFLGDFIDRMAQKARAHDTLQITTQAGTPTPVQDLADHLMLLGAHMAIGAPTPPLLHLAGQPVTDRAAWVETALAGGLSARRIERVAMASFADGAARPLGTPLDCSLYEGVFGPAPDWRTAARAWGDHVLQR